MSKQLINREFSANKWDLNAIYVNIDDFLDCLNVRKVKFKAMEEENIPHLRLSSKLTNL